MAVESPPWALQAGSYPAEQTRRAVFMWAARTAANTPGIVAGGLASTADCQVTAPGSGLSVNVSTGEMLIPGNEGGTQGPAYARVSSTTNAVVSTANPTNPRIDRIVALMSDAGYTEPTGGSGSQWAISVVTGTATSGASLANLTGAAAVPGSSLLLANLLVPAAAANIITADIANVATTGLIPDTALQSPNNGYRKTLSQASAAAVGGLVSGNYLITNAGLLASATSVGAVAPALWAGDSNSDFRVANKTSFGLIRANLVPNATSAGITVTFGLYQITASGGASGNISYTFGSALAGSTAALTAGGALAAGEGAAFALPSSGIWALGVALSGTVPAAAQISLNAQLLGFNA